MFAEHMRGQPKFTRRICIHMADLAGIPPMSMVWRLEKMKLLKQGSWDWFKSNGGITKAHIAEVRSDLANASRPEARPQTPQGPDTAPTQTQIKES